MKNKTIQQLTFLIVTVLLLTACGGGSTSSPPISGQLIDAPVANITYVCNGGKTDKTEDDGTFTCEEFPVLFFVGNIELGRIESITSDSKVYPQDIAGVSRNDFFDDYSMRISYLLQALDSDGDISKTINIDESVIVSDKKYLKLLSYIEIDKILEESGKTPFALEDVRTHLMDNADNDVDTTKARDQQAVNIDSEMLSLGNLSNVTTNLIFPTKGEHNSNISYTIRNGTAITSTGEVIRPSFLEKDQSITIVATITKGEAKKSKTFIATVRALAISDVEAITLAEEDLKIAGTLSAIDSDIELITVGLHGVTVSWASSSSVISSTGVVSRPAFSEGNVVVQLTATLTKGSETRTKVFNLTVLKLSISDTESVSNVKENLTLANINALRANLTLPTTIDGVTLTWSSSDESVVSSSGVIFPSNYQGADKTARLTVTLTKGSVTDTKSFDVLVPKLAMSDAEAVALEKQGLLEGYDRYISEDISLPLSIYENGVSISWESNNTSILSDSGVVDRPSYSIGNIEVKLTATLRKGEVSDRKEFLVIVLAYDMTDTEAVALEKRDLYLSDTFNAIEEDVTFPSAVHDNGVSTSWESNNSSVISNIGEVTRPTSLQGNMEVTLTATFTKGEVSDSKSFTVLVMALPITDEEAVSLAKENLTLVNTSNIIENLTLPTTGIHGTTITYSSSNSNVVSATGEVTRPNYVVGDVSVTLTGTISKNGVSETKVFVLTVSKLDAITADLPNLAVDTAVNSMTRIYGDYTFEIRTDGIAPVDATQNAVTVFGKTSLTGLEDADTITFALHGEYASGTKFQLIIKNTNGAIVAKSGLSTFTTGMVDIGFGTIQVP